LLRVELDDENELGERIVMIPPSFARFDHAYCLTNHKSQGRTFDSAYTLANPSMCDREWTYVAASRSRFSTTIYSNLGVLQAVDLEGHQEREERPSGREAAIDALSLRMRRSRAKGTTLDYEDEVAMDISAPERAKSKRFSAAAKRLFAPKRSRHAHAELTR
jgi:ATP-dependent exoDNAse (exonuclease V) alpha subunit